MAIENIYRVTVNLERGHDILYEVQTRRELDEPFERDFIKATNKSFNAQTDGYNGALFADFSDLQDAKDAEVLMEAIAVKYEALVQETIEQEEKELNEDE